MSQERLEQLRSEAYQLPAGPAKVAIFEEAVREADALGDLDAAWQLRDELVHSAIFSGFVEKAIVAFSWMLSRYDESPEEFDPEDSVYDLMWKYKWIVENTFQFPQITRTQIEGMLADMQARYLSCGYSLRPVHYMQMTLAMRLGDLDQALELAKLWQREKRDSMADCKACECDHLAELHFRRGEDEPGLQVAAPILAGRLQCAEIPHKTLAKILVPLLRLQRLDDAQKYHAKGYRKVARDREFLPELAEHLLFLVHASDFDNACKLFREHYEISQAASDLNGRFRFQLAGWMLLENLDKSGKRASLASLPANATSEFDENADLFDSLRAKLQGETKNLAQRFNTRNGNAYYTQQIVDAWHLIGLPDA